MDKLELYAEVRTEFGTGAARRLRAKGMVPATIYGSNKSPISVILKESEINKYYKKPLYISQLFSVTLDNKKYNILPKDVDLDPVTDIVRHADFMFLHDKIQKINIPIIYKNKLTCQGVKRGGYFNTIYRSIMISCPVQNLPRSINIDVSNFLPGESIKSSNLSLPEGASLCSSQDVVIASIIGRKGKSDTEDKDEGTDSAAAK